MAAIVWDRELDRERFEDARQMRADFAQTRAPFDAKYAGEGLSLQDAEMLYRQTPFAPSRLDPHLTGRRLWVTEWNAWVDDVRQFRRSKAPPQQDSSNTTPSTNQLLLLCPLP